MFNLCIFVIPQQQKILKPSCGGHAKPKAAGGKPVLRVRTRGQQAADRRAEDVMAFSNQHYGTSVTKDEDYYLDGM
jgi:hypothetical protein